MLTKQILLSCTLLFWLTLWECYIFNFWSLLEKSVRYKIHVSIKDIVLYLLPIPMLNQCIFVLYHCGPVVLASFSDRSTSDQTSHFSTLFILINSKRQTNLVAWKTNSRAFNVTYNNVDSSFLNQSSCYNQLFGAGLPWSLQWFMCNTGFS